MRPVAVRCEASRSPSFHRAHCYLPTFGIGSSRFPRTIAFSPSRRFASVAAENEDIRGLPPDVLQACSTAQTSRRADDLMYRATRRLQGQRRRKTLYNLHPDERKELVYATLRAGQPNQILDALSDVQNAHIIATMPDSVFVSALLLLTPEHFLEPYKKILGRLHNYVVLAQGYRPFSFILDKYFEDLVVILKLRQRGSATVGLPEYSHLLRWAACAGELSLALNIWDSMEKRGIQPDTNCYNSCLVASLWDQVHVGKERYRLRVTPYYYYERTKTSKSWGYRGFGTGPQSVRRSVFSIIYQMHRANIPTNEETYVNALLAQARIGYSPGIHQILMSTWGIDVSKLKDGTENHPPVKPMSRASPLYPSANLLWTVAHAFGINNDFPTALRTVEFISQKYDIKITDEVWLELFERAYVLSKRTFNDPRGQLPGQIPQEIVHRVFEMMESTPSHSKMHVYRNLSRLGSDRLALPKFLSILEDAYSLLLESKKKRKNALLNLEKCIGLPLRVDTSYLPLNEDALARACNSPAVWEALREYELIRLQVLQQRALVERIVRLGIMRVSWGLPYGDFSRQLLPEFLAEWKDFLPECFFISLPTGRIEFLGRTTFQHQNLRPHSFEAVRRSKCGEFIAEGEELEYIDNYLWSHLKLRLGEYAEIQPFHGFYERSWRYLDKPGENHLFIYSRELNNLREKCVVEDCDREECATEGCVREDREVKFQHYVPECFIEEMGDDPELGLQRASKFIEMQMKDGSFRVNLTPIERWY